MDRALDYLVELEREDDRIAGEMRALDDFATEAEALRSRGQELSSFLEQLPAEQARVAGEVDRTERETAEAEAAYEQACVELAAAEESDNEERLSSARRFERRAKDMVGVAKRRGDEARAAVDDLNRSAAKVEEEVPELVENARRLNEKLSGGARVSIEPAESSPSTLAEVAPWGRQARAAILVARAGLATERDSIVRQANEIGSAVLGESLGASSAATVARRVESASGRAG